MLSSNIAHAAGAGRRLRPVTIACVAAAFVAASCTGRPWWQRTTTTTQRPVSGNTLDTVSYRAEFQQARATGQLPWYCTAQGLGGHMDHRDAGGLAHDYYAGKTKGTLSVADCDTLTTQFDQIIRLVRPYKTRGDARRAGGYQLVQFVPGLGTHDSVLGFTRIGLPPGAPMFLQYDGPGDDAPLAGLSWFAITGGAPPAGFPGDNDWWHSHSTLCFTGLGVVRGNEISDEECARRGGVNRALPGVWMSHAWIIPGYEDRYDVFSGAFMCLKGTGVPPTSDDPCHDDHSNPEHEGGEHDMGAMTTTTAPTGHGDPRVLADSAANNGNTEQWMERLANDKATGTEDPSLRGTILGG